MRVLMLGWEFPPFISGGLGTACYGLTKAMSEIGTDILFLLPKPLQSTYTSHVKLMAPGKAGILSGISPVYEMEEFKHVTFRTIDAAMGMTAYQTPEEYAMIQAHKGKVAKRSGQETEQNGEPEPQPVAAVGGGAHYAGDMFSEIERYARLATLVAQREQFDVIHAHDWMTYRAGIAVSALTGKPLVVHVHSTEFDRSGEHVDQRIYEIERQGLHFANQVIAVSTLTKNIVTTRYGVPASRVNVVYNAIDLNGSLPSNGLPDIARDEKLVLFLGRITMQKGPEYFLAAAKKVLDVIENVRFIMAGSGDMIKGVIELAAKMGIGHKVLFTGFLRGPDVDRVFRMADLYVMPSVSEPFGIAPLEAMSNDVPVLISKQSGVSEVLNHVLKVDFWDVNEMANKIIAVLRHAPLQSTLREHGRIEVRKLSWTDSAQRCVEVYEKALGATAASA